MGLFSNFDFEKVNAVRDIIMAGLSWDEIKDLAETKETSPNLKEDAALEDIKAEANKTSVETLPTDKKEDPIESLRNLIKED